MSGDSPTFEDIVAGTEFEPDEVPDPREEEHLFEWFDPDGYDRDDELLAQIADPMHTGEPSENQKLLYFVAAREAGIRRGIDITAQFDIYNKVSKKIDCEQVGYRLQVAEGSYFDPPSADCLSLNHTQDWERLKEILRFDEDNWPMESLGDFIEEVAGSDE
jgi:hypothetical protein